MKFHITGNMIFILIFMSREITTLQMRRLWFWLTRNWWRVSRCFLFLLQWMPGNFEMTFTLLKSNLFISESTTLCAFQFTVFTPLDLHVLFMWTQKCSSLFDSLKISKFMWNEIKSIVCMFINWPLEKHFEKMESSWVWFILDLWIEVDLCAVFPSDLRGCRNLFVFLLFYHSGIYKSKKA